MTTALLQRKPVAPVGQLLEIGDDLEIIDGICARASAADPFARSAGYFAMTGRKGLWIYAEDRTAMLVCRHPNRADRLLLFPPVGDDAAGLLATALSDPRLPPGRRQLVRVTDESRALAQEFNGGAALDREDVLDWAYPVHVVSTEAIVRREGGAFNNLRGHIHRAGRAGLKVVPLDLEQHGSVVREVVGRWAEAKVGHGFTYEDLTGPTERCLELMENGRGRLEGVVVLDGEHAVGFWICDLVGADVAASLVRVSIGGLGAAELAAAGLAGMLWERGIGALCLGGSETASLDQFKRKLGPVRSVELGTVTLG